LLWAYQQVFHGKEAPRDNEPAFPEMKVREGLVLAPLIVLIVVLGIYPKPVLDRISPSVDALVNHVAAVAHPKIPLNGRPLHVQLSVKEHVTK
jgi:NADH-quinone oxidoreductase subunit M